MSEDLIKRSDAIDMINEAFDIGDCFCDRYGLIGAIQSISIADRPKGEWIGNNLDGTFKVWDCSECGIHMEIRWNFCPNCGARMNADRKTELQTDYAWK